MGEGMQFGGYAQPREGHLQRGHQAPCEPRERLNFRQRHIRGSVERPYNGRPIGPAASQGGQLIYGQVGRECRANQRILGRDSLALPPLESAILVEHGTDTNVLQ